jgi:hypothetical protein
MSMSVFFPGTESKGDATGSDPLIIWCCGASSQAKGPSDGHPEPTDVSTPNPQECQEQLIMRKPEPEAHREQVTRLEVSAASPEASIPIAPAQGQADSPATPHRGDASETCEPHIHAHQEPVTGPLPSSTQPTTIDDRSSGHDGSCAPNGTPFPGLLLETLRSQMIAGFQRRNEQFLQEIFDKHKSPDTAGLSKESLAQALSDLGVCLSAEDVGELFYTQDLNSDGCISWSEFLMVISKPSKIEHWATALPLGALLADCMPSKNDVDPLRGLSNLLSADVEAVSVCFSEGLVKLLRYVLCSHDVLSECAHLKLAMDVIYKTYYTHFASTSKQSRILGFCNRLLTAVRIQAIKSN